MEIPEAKAVDERESKEISRGKPLFEVFRIRNFLLLWIGQGFSLLGDQFQFIALPWLVLQLTGTGLAIGAVLAIAGIPRALFMLVGGALTDRFSPRVLMLGSTLLRFGLVTVLAALVLTNVVELWMLYVFALVFGLVDAFFYPSQMSMVPQVVDRELLQIGNALIQGVGQLSMFVGPVLAGVLIAWLGSGEQVAGAAKAAPDMKGIGFAFGFSAITYLISITTLWLIRIGKGEKQINNAGETESVLSSIKEGLATVWNDITLRTTFLIVSAISLLINGPFIVGIPILASSRFPEGAVAYGTIMSAWGAGSLLGLASAGALPKPPANRLGQVLMLLISIPGFGLVLLGIVSSVTIASLIGIVMGAANGYVVITYTTWLQRRTPQAMLGRMMSVLMFAVVGLNPVSMMLAGALIDLSPTALMVGAGSILILILFVSAFNPAVQDMGLERVSSHDGRVGMS